MYRQYNLNELAQSIQVLQEDNTKNNLGEEVGLLTLLAKIGFDPRDIKDFAEYCGLRLYDSKKYNEDYNYKDNIDKTHFKKYLLKKIEKLSDILERLEVKEPRSDKGKLRSVKAEIKKTPKIADIPPRSNEEFGIALGKIINYTDTDLEMLSHLIDCEGFKIQGYLTGEYKNPSKEFIEEISSFFGIDPRHFLEYRKYLGKDYKEDRPITLTDFRITKKRRELFELPEQSSEEFRISFRKIVGASGIAQKELANIMRCSEGDLYEYTGKDYHSTGNPLFKKFYIKKISEFFNIDPCYFKEYRENETMEKILADVIKHKNEIKDRHKEDAIIQ